MLCWQNPVVVAGQLSPQHQGLHTFAELLHALAWAGMLTFWLLMIDGLRYTVLPKRFYLAKVCRPRGVVVPLARRSCMDCVSA